MSWKNWPYWLRGGNLALSIGLLLVLIGIPITFLGLYLDCPSGEGVCDTGIISIIGGILVVLPTWPFRALEISIILEFIIFIAQFFIIGALISWIYGKIKSKKRKK